METPAISVSEYLDYLNLALYQTSVVRLFGEVTEVKATPQGVFLTLKDVETGSATMSVYAYASVYRSLGVTLETGQQVFLTGRPNIYKAKGRLSFVFSQIEFAGDGAHKANYERLKTQLEREGLFTRKRDLPENISRVVLITSPKGAAIGDFKTNLAPFGIEVDIYPVRVEGEHAVSEIIEVLSGLQISSTTYDCVVLMRGGGSQDDLDTFNQEQLVRAVFACKFPTLVAIGHDKDTPLAQLVADSAASTPTALAHTINAQWKSREEVELLSEKIKQYAREVVVTTNMKIEEMVRTLNSHASDYIEETHGLFEQLRYATEKLMYSVKSKREHVDHLDAQLKTLDPRRVMNKGFSLVYTKDKKLVTRGMTLRNGDLISLTFSDSDRNATITP